MASRTLEDFGPKTSRTLHALDSFWKYWNENERLIETAARLEAERTRPPWVPQTDDEHDEFCWEQRMARQFHDEVMTPTFRYSCIVMLCVIVEGEMLRLLENLEEERGKQKLRYKDLRGSVLDQVSTFADVFFNLRWVGRPEYESLRDLQKIRNCIVHCRGNLALYKKDECAYLIGLKNSCPGFYAWEGDQIDIESKCIGHFLREAWQFFIWIFKELGWKVADSWSEKGCFPCERTPGG